MGSEVWNNGTTFRFSPAIALFAAIREPRSVRASPCRGDTPTPASTLTDVASWPYGITGFYVANLNEIPPF
ncbi:hypothetical protein [Paenibacillus oryzisoli]|uniref:hypothetical protein n=1 Tax=Paenibacillus oryzisoli TaxID=1850517 RepID=UPI00195B189C|nr:hypothetical protein [Paenibacillus oryzisoli]